MSVNSYLNNLAQRAIVRNNEKEKNQISVKNILGKLDNHFSDRIEKISRYGSHKRNTNLSKKFDDPDVDIMVIFKDNKKTPQTYLNWLKKFTKAKYPNSLCEQSFPAVVLELNHIKFDLVPAIIDDCGQYKIPRKRTSNDWYQFDKWIPTNPNDLDGALINNQTLRRLVRVAKIWNAKQGYIYESYELEKWIIHNSFYGNPNENLAQHFYRFCELLPINRNLSQENQRKIQKLKDSAKRAEYSDDKSTIQDLFE